MSGYHFSFATLNPLQVRMAGGGGCLDMNGGPGTAAVSEAEDARREAEEADCVFSAEDLERCAAASEQQHMLF